jgi:hypothetical protein
MATAKSNGNAKGKPVEQLNHFLRGEMSAVETYKLALDHLEANTHARSNLETCLQSHQQRVSLLRQAIAKLGGVAETSSPAWPTVVSILEGSHETIGDKAAIAAIEEGETLELEDYRKDLASLDSGTKPLVEQHLLPRQQQTQYAISELRKTLH